ncbi:BRO-N domain-containing protein [Pseudomonas sp. AF03-9]|uniref:BRO-N domain-containing protein n=1 Tax=Pseudomonas sp. AF03-9 TaxID=2849867 RepID=UPI001CFA0FCD|nr:BRO family protein [Pseudomonas sp. AF03-9]
MSQVQTFGFDLVACASLKTKASHGWWLSTFTTRWVYGNTEVSWSRRTITKDLESANLCRPPPGRECWLISEPDLYKLIMRSDKPEARTLQDWVTRVVLPAICKDGAYVLGE